MSTSPPSPIPGHIDALADFVCTDTLPSLKELGTFHATPPPPPHTPPSTFRLERGNLGLASWSLNPLYLAAKHRLRQNRTDWRAASVALLVAPDLTTAWNVRKHHLTSLHVSEELIFSAFVLSHSPKSAEAWAHRGWVLRVFGCSQSQAMEELELAWNMASRAKSNYYAGVHRFRVFRLCSADFLRTEMKQSQTWLQKNVSDSSGWWYHRLLITYLARHVGFLAVATEHRFADQMYNRYRNTHQCVTIHKEWLSSVASGMRLGSPDKFPHTVALRTA